MNGNAVVLRALFAELDALGVREFCVCAGARNAPIIDALTRNGAPIRSFFDERSAAFFALGRVMQIRVPVAVLTTSGTAVAELHPAMVEAHYQNLPLVAISADRPSGYTGSGAPQAIEQRAMFGIYASQFVEIECAADGGIKLTRLGSPSGGPAHFNVRLEEKLGVVETADLKSPVARQAAPMGPDHSAAEVPPCWREFWGGEGDLVVLAAGLHPADVPSARDFLLRLDRPIVAEATANLHGEEALKHLMLRGGEEVLRVFDFKRVLRLGCVPSWRWWRDLEDRDEISVLGISRSPFRGLARSTKTGVVPWELPGMAGPVSHGPRDAMAPATAIAAKLDSLIEAHPNSEPAWMRHLSRIVGAGSTVFLGNSLPLREWNLAADVPKPGTAFFANRGANGIDGLVSTWLGLSVDAREAWLIAGDLSALHDMNAGWILTQLPVAKRRIVVINNGGGKIFSQVRWLDSLTPEAKRVMGNPHTISFEPWARMWGMNHRLLADSRELADDDADGCVWEIRPDAAQTGAFWRAWRSC